MAQRNQTDQDVGLEAFPFQVHLNPQDVDEFITSHGVLLVHHRAMRCPVGLKHKYDARTVEVCHMGCSNGFLYTSAGEVLCVFNNNNAKLIQYDPGLLTGSSVVVTASRFYLDGQSIVQLAQFDRLYLPDEGITVPYWQTFEANEQGTDRMNFPVTEVVDLMDNLGNRYYLGDFKVVEGNIVWSGKRPGVDPDTGSGRVCSIRFKMRPYFIVSELVHEIRVATTVELDGSLSTTRMPQSAILKREYVYHTEANDPDAANKLSSRQSFVPPSGGFGSK